MPTLAYSFTCFMGVFSVLLIGWQGHQGYVGGWVFGFLAVIWSLLMMARLITLSVPQEAVFASKNLAQKILHHFYLRREEHRRILLLGALGGSYPVFVLAMFLFLGWQIYCTLNPSEKAMMDGLSQNMAMIDSSITADFQTLYAQAQTIMMALFACVVAFVFRSHAQNKNATRPLIIVVAGYAVSGLIAFYGLPQGLDASPLSASWAGSGAGTGAWLPVSGTPALFDIILVETGVLGLAILAFALFVPLGGMTLHAKAFDGGDKITLICSMIVAMCLILAIFLPLTASLGAYIAMCFLGVFAGWGALENPAIAPSFARA